MNFNSSIYLLFASILLFPGCAFESNNLKEVDSLINALHAKDHFDGSLVIGNKSGIIYSNSIGIAQREWSVPIEVDTRFDIASLNKSFIASMIMQMVEADKISLDDPLSKHLNYRDLYASEITIHQMLTHTAGMPDYNAIPDSLKANGYEPFKRLHFTNDEYVEFIGDLMPVGRVGKQFYYSNFAYHLLAVIIEKIERKHFSAALDSMICKPLNLENTYSPLDNYIQYDRLASSYQMEGETYIKSPFIDYSIGRRIFSTSEDLYAWGLEMINPTLISDTSNQKILTNHTEKIDSSISYGYGWVIFDGKADYKMGKLDVDSTYIIHGGSTDGFRSLLTIYNKGEWIVASLSNTGDQTDHMEITEKILNTLNK